jgi:plasmid stabilization system protein ParE
MEVTVAPKARGDIASILAWTEENFGPLTRYAKLIATAIEQIAENPERVGSSQRPEINDVDFARSALVLVAS